MKHHIDLLRLKLLFELSYPTVIRYYSYYIVTYYCPVSLVSHILERSCTNASEKLKVLCNFAHFKIIVGDHKSERGLSMWVIENFKFLVWLKHQDHMAIA